MFPAAIRHATLFAAALTLAPLVAEESRANLIGEAKGITFSGYDRDAEGRRRWTMEANSARPEDKSGKRWLLDALRLKTLDKAGAAELRMEAPRARFDSETHRASDTGRVTLEGERISLAGSDWSWSHAGDTDVFELRAGVRVTLRPPADRADREPSVLEARTLRLEHGPTGRTLTLTGDVRVTRGGATMRADTVTTRLAPDRRDRLANVAPASADKNAVERIVADGAVELRHQNALVTGARAEVTPADGLYVITGGAEFHDLGERRIRVRGDSIRYDAPAARITVSPDADGRVRAELPALDHTPGARAEAAAEALDAHIGKDAVTLVMTGAVTIDDPANRVRCGRLEVVTPHAGDTAAITGAPAAKGVSRMVAEDAVTLTRDRRTIRCGRVEMLPPLHRVTLTGAPRGEDETTGAALEADRMTLDTEADTLLAEAGTARPVRVTLPARTVDAQAPAAAEPFALEAGAMLASRRGEHAAVFEFEDRVTLEGPDLAGGCERLGVEMTLAKPAPGRPAASVRRIVATGRVSLRQAAYAAEADRAEILPAPPMEELTVKEDNGLDGRSPFVVTLDASEDTRARVTLPPVRMPRLPAPDGPGADIADAPPEPVTVEAKHHEMIAGRERLRAFARDAVRVSSATFEGECASLESRAVSVATTPAGKPAFEAEAVVARGGVRMRLGTRRAAADTLEIMPRERRLTLSGHPSVDGWLTPPGTARKTIRWTPLPGANAASTTTRVTLRDEPEAGMPEQILRPRITIPAEIAPDLGRSFRKNLDKDAR